ncbi:ATP-dependent RNA helicase DbpA [Alkalimonas collagenimarina]|uniref:ATP-dependent RNA helicase DbpA n=1 Tax=Alkalimonas collagenimarina TaxID=400390 RepID=A0ABT9GXB6_9GAMM|nr:ATP-dependent RNA helicase DbpA [Alkalimonas collagenimarina]MDP4535698.1 ATP-dependent RNA helicase DbpA [Alkalimonas collagenimarina]
MSTTDFSTLSLTPALLSTLQELNYQQMTPIQQQSLPAILAGQDVIAQAQTGSGKTAVFALGMLSALKVKRFRIQGLVLCPTRELAEQVANELRTLGRSIHNIKVLTLCGGVPSRHQTLSLEHGAHFIVGTPGRVLDHLQQQRLDLSELSMLVLDEADRMLEMGFQDDVATIAAAMPAQRQTLLFSATYPAKIEQLAASLMRDPIRVSVAANPAQNQIEQQFFSLAGSSRELAVMLLLQQFQPASCVVFCNTKRVTQQLADALQQQGFSAMALHGDLEQKDRDQTLLQFANKSARILVATDVAARGLDISELDLVINAELAHDTDTHTHRIGRTGRAGLKGQAFTLIDGSDDYKLSLLQDDISDTIQLQSLPAKALLDKTPVQADMVTIQIQGGKKQKLRPGDIVGALTRDQQVAFEDVGKIQLHDLWAYVAVKRSAAKKALQILNHDKMKGRSFRAWQL